MDRAGAGPRLFFTECTAFQMQSRDSRPVVLLLAATLLGFGCYTHATLWALHLRAAGACLVLRPPLD